MSPVCGANDISWSTRSETQAGGYILVIAQAKPGITLDKPVVTNWHTSPKDAVPSR
ncbi:hypothetical protein K7B06_34735 [Streptomyces erythrochromogenes]|nr:hypothetical protein [Streptomyces erythrochromogenes]